MYSSSAKAMNILTNIGVPLQENRLVFAYGPSIDITALRILTAIQALSGGAIFFAFKSNSEARAVYSLVTGIEGPMGYGLAVGDVPLHAAPEFDIYSDRVIFCTTGKLRNILLEQIRREHMAVFGWFIVQSWDEHDVNAYVVANLARKHTEAPITLLSCSKWSPLPYSDSVSVECPRDGHHIEYYTKPLSTLADSLLAGDIFYGPDSSLGALRGKVEWHSDPIYNDSASAVVDTLKDMRKRPISKHLADVRANSIREGIVYRLASETEFESLRARDPVPVSSGLEETVLYLKRYGIDPLTAFGSNYPVEEVKKAIAALGDTALNEDELDKIVSLRMGVSSGLFYVSWTGRGLSSSRNRYIAGLIAALIEYSPSVYAPVESYARFVGRNDIETLCNVWSSLILSRSDPFWSWVRDGPIIGWCKNNGFNKDAVSRLVANVKRVCLGMKGEVGLFDKIKTEELNIASDIFRELESRRGIATATKWDMKKALPSSHSTSLGNVLPVLRHGKVLDIYIDRSQKFVKPPIQAESVSMFYGL